MLYTSCENKKIKDIKKLNNKKFRDISKKFIVEGEHLVEEALKANLLLEVLIEDGYDYSIDSIVNFVTPNVLKYISNLDNPPKVIGICKMKEEHELKNRVLILDGVQDPGNLGTIIRSSVAFNITDIVLSDNCVDLYNSKVIRATQGMLFNINIVNKNIVNLVKDLKNKEYSVYGTKVDGGKSIKNVEKREKFVIIVGNEGNGVSKEVLDLCSDYIYINMNKKCESLNVAIATSIILYELDK